MENMKELNMKELDKVNGGAIVEIEGKYYAAEDPKEGQPAIFVKTPFDTVEEAQAKARAYGWSTTVYTEKEYYEKFGYRLRL